MERRAFLRGTLTGCAVGLAGVATARGARQDSGFEPLGEVALEGTKEVVVSEDGTTAFAAVTDGFATVDVSDPAEPRVLATDRSVFADHEDGPLRQIWDVKYDAGDLVVASQTGANGRLFAFVVFDVRDPANPRRRLAREVDGPIHNCDLDRGHVYLTANHAGHHDTAQTDGTGTERRPRLPVEIYDVRGFEATKVADWSPLDLNDGWREVPPENRVIHDVSIVGERAYLAYWDAGTFVLDVSTPTEPTFLARVGDFTAAELASRSTADLTAEQTEGPTGNAHYASASPDGSVLAVGKEGWDVPRTDGGGPGGIDLYDASDPADPVHTTTIDPEPAPDETRAGLWTTAHNFELTSDRLYSAWYRAGVKLHDISDPTDPQLLAWWLRPRARSFWTAQVGRRQEFFVAASARDRSGQVPSSEEALLTFPDRAGEQPDRPAIEEVFEPTSTPGQGPSPRDGTETERTEVVLPTHTARSPTDSAAESPASDPAVPGGVPGYGALAAVLGLGIWGYRTLRRRG